MTITLPPELEKLIREKVERGEYDSPDAFVGEAVHLLIDEETDEDVHRDEILERVQRAETKIDGGEYREYDEHNIHELAADVHERGLKKLVVERRETSSRR